MSENVSIQESNVKRKLYKQVDYSKVIDYFEKNKRKPIFISTLHAFLRDELLINQSANRSRVIRKLIDWNLIKKIGMPTSKLLVRVKS